MTIRCEAITIIEEEEQNVGVIRVECVPRVGEFLWFSEKRMGSTSWKVTEVAHWVGSGESTCSYQAVALYVERVGGVSKEEERLG